MNKNRDLKKSKNTKKTDNTTIEEKKNENMPMYILVYDIISKTSI